MMANKDTVVCISISEKQSNFGADFHNSCYEKLGSDYVYFPRKVNDENLNAEFCKNTWHKRV